MNKHYVINIDLVDSKKLNDWERFDVQNKLLEVVEIINLVYSDYLIKELNVSAGDSIQGIFKSIVSIYNAFLLIQNMMFPQKIRAGIGYGSLNQNMLNNYTDKNSNIYDGIAYHLARNALDKAKKNMKSIQIQSKKKIDEIVNTLIDDEALIKTTITRSAIYSMINLISPQIEDSIIIDDSYFRRIRPFINSINRFYKTDGKSIKEKNTFIMNEDNNYYQYNQYYNAFNLNSRDKHLGIYDYKIESSTRSQLSELTGSSIQNINSIIKSGNMEFLRERSLAKSKLLNELYIEDN